jgi:hypothetical protein
MDSEIVVPGEVCLAGDIGLELGGDKVDAYSEAAE